MLHMEEKLHPSSDKMFIWDWVLLQRIKDPPCIPKGPRHLLRIQ